MRNAKRRYLYEKEKIYVHIKTPIILHGNFIVALIWEQPKYPSTGK